VCRRSLGLAQRTPLYFVDPDLRLALQLNGVTENGSKQVTSDASQPLVSICIPTFNSVAYLKGAIASALGQTYFNIEILIFDNSSADDTESVVREIAAKDRRVRYERHSENVGMIRNFNSCIHSASGKYLKFICSDDEISPNCIFEMVNAMERNPQVTLVACSRNFVDHAMNWVGQGHYSKNNVHVDGMAAIRRCFFFGNAIGEPTAVMFRKSSALRGFTEQYPQLMDLEMWFHLLKEGQFEFLSIPLCNVRKHRNQATTSNLKSGVVLEDKRQLFREFVKDIGSTASIFERAVWDIRMAITIKRTQDAGRVLDFKSIREVFSPTIFSWVWRPLVALIWPFFLRSG
jgi:glycosyltransferase involved in cell wall biosynthesis